MDKQRTIAEEVDMFDDDIEELSEEAAGDFLKEELVARVIEYFTDYKAYLKQKKEGSSTSLIKMCDDILFKVKNNLYDVKKLRELVLFFQQIKEDMGFSDD